MTMRPGPTRQPVASALWCTDERFSALQIARTEIEEFAYSSRNELEWLNEHMADIFSDNHVNVADIFKTPGKLRGKTPRHAHTPLNHENRVPLSNIFSVTSKTTPRHLTTVSTLDHNTASEFRIAEDRAVGPAKPASVTRKPVPANPTVQGLIQGSDSGYDGSQMHGTTVEIDDMPENVESTKPQYLERISELPKTPVAGSIESQSFERRSSATSHTSEILESDSEQQTKKLEALSPRVANEESGIKSLAGSSPLNLLESYSPQKPQPETSSPSASSSFRPQAAPTHRDKANEAEDEPGDELAHEAPVTDEVNADVTRSPSEGSSPIRPLVRKSSLYFASLPAREPMTSNKSLGSRMSRSSHVDPNRMSYYPRQTEGKSLGIRSETQEDGQVATDIGNDDDAAETVHKTNTLIAQTKSYTQRLQDQINMLGKLPTGGARPSKSIPNLAGVQKTIHNAHSHSQAPQITHPTTHEKAQSPIRSQQSTRTPGAFPEDNADNPISPSTTNRAAVQSSLTVTEKHSSANLMDKVPVGNSVDDDEDLGLTHQPPQDQTRLALRSPYRPVNTPSISAHTTSVSVNLSNRDDLHESPPAELRKFVSVSNPTSPSHDVEMVEPPKSPSRTLRERPVKHSALKQVKNKFSSILKGSRGLIASGAALNAEGQATLVNSPSDVRMTKHATTYTEPLRLGNRNEPLHPELSEYASLDSQALPPPLSSSRTTGQTTRASAERNMKEQKRKGREEREVKHLAVQMDKLEREREKEREKAHCFGEEPDMITAKQLAPQKDHERAMRTPAPKEVPVSTRTSPRKAKAQGVEARVLTDTDGPAAADHDVDMIDAPASKTGPMSISRPTPGQTLKNRRPTKPTKVPAIKAKQAPTLIRVNTSSQHTGFHPSNNVLSATLQDTLGGPQQQIKGKPSQPSLQKQGSQQILNNSVNSSTGRPKALDLAAKRKQQEEREAQRKRDVKAEIERKRAAVRDDERRQEQERRERERLEEEAKKKVQRQAAIEKAKQTRAPPPATRSQPNGPPEYNTVRDKASIPRPASRLQPSTTHRSLEDFGHAVKPVLSSAAKMPLKRPLQQDVADDGMQRPTASQIGPSQQKDVKRMRMSDEFNFEEEMEIQSYGTNMKGPPMRPSAGFKKDLQNNPLYSGYVPAPQSATRSATRDIFKAPVASQHQKSGISVDMAQVSKAPIPFVPSQPGDGASHKTPARPGAITVTKSAAKSAARSSPRFQNGENIELPEIQTDDDDDDDDDDEEVKGLGVASWADTPALRRELMRQETVDPIQVFGPPAPLNMEEVFNKSKDKWHKFRARTSSANWSGADRLTEEEIRKDLAARDKMRRDGRWTYELSKEIS